MAIILVMLVNLQGSGNFKTEVPYQMPKTRLSKQMKSQVCNLVLALLVNSRFVVIRTVIKRCGRITNATTFQKSSKSKFK